VFCLTGVVVVAMPPEESEIAANAKRFR
jgi:hypothetical protein